MKRTILVLVLLSLVALPSFAQLRLDIGVDIPRGMGAMLEGSGADMSQETVDFFNNYFFPFPEAALHYQFDAGMIKLGAGVRAFTLILETALWPNVFAELNVGPLAVEAQVGGGIFGLIGLYNGIQTGQLFFPDLSAWYKFGKAQNFRLGAGVIGFYLPELANDAMVFCFYLGGKFAFVFKE